MNRVPGVREFRKYKKGDGRELGRQSSKKSQSYKMGGVIYSLNQEGEGCKISIYNMCLDWVCFVIGGSEPSLQENQEKSFA